jgi:hypothetical protein
VEVPTPDDLRGHETFLRQRRAVVEEYRRGPILAKYFGLFGLLALAGTLFGSPHAELVDQRLFCSILRQIHGATIAGTLHRALCGEKR